MQELLSAQNVENEIIILFGNIDYILTIITCYYLLNTMERNGKMKSDLIYTIKGLEIMIQQSEDGLT